MPVIQTIKEGVYIISKFEIIKQIFIPPSIGQKFPALSKAWLIVTIIVAASQVVKKYQSYIAWGFLIISLTVYLWCVCLNIYKSFQKLTTLNQENTTLREKLQGKLDDEKGFNIRYNENEVSITYNGEYKNDTALKNVIVNALNEYQASNEKQKAKWREEWENEISHMKF